MSSGETSSHGAADTAVDAVWREQRPFMVDLAFRMLGNFSTAEDVVQEAFSRLLRADLDAIEDVRGWLVVVVSRICLDELRSARSRRQELGFDPDAAAAPHAPDPADRLTLDDDVQMALLVVLQRLSPAERTVFVLHDVFRFSFDTAAAIVGRTPEACRKLASRARHRIQEERGPGRFVVAPSDPARVAERFIAACAGGDIDALMELLDPDVVGEADLGEGYPRQLQAGRDRVARNLLRFFRGDGGVTLVSHPVNGELGVLAFHRGNLVALMSMEVRNALIVDIHAVADPAMFAAAGLPTQPEA